MAELRKFYWLKLPRGFFKRHDMEILKAMSGKEAVMFFMQLMLESIDHEGELRFSPEVPYTPAMLAVITDTDPVIAGKAVETLLALKLMYVTEDGTYVIPMAKRLIGQETSDAERKREERKKEKEPVQPSLDTTRTTSESVRTESEVPGDCPLEIELEIEKEEENINSGCAGAAPSGETGFSSSEVEEGAKTPEPSNPSPSPPAKRSPEDSLKDFVRETFLTVQPGKRFKNYPKENTAVRELVREALARAPTEPQGFLEAMMRGFLELKRSGDRFWTGQPFTPSALNTSSIFDRVLEYVMQRARAEAGTQGLSEVPL